jgi:hypothetical protein
MEIDTSRPNNRYTTQCKVDEEMSREEEKQIMCMKKLLLATNLDSCQDLLHYFHDIDAINDKYFNEINIFADQVDLVLFRATKSKNIFGKLKRLRSRRK